MVKNILKILNLIYVSLSTYSYMHILDIKSQIYINHFLKMTLFFSHTIYYKYSFTCLHIYQASLSPPRSIAPVFPLRKKNTSQGSYHSVTRFSKFRINPSYQGWMKQLNRRKNISGPGSRVRDTLLPLLGVQ